MAIQITRCQYVSRSTGGNACRKASYNQRDAIRCERTGELFSFKDRGGNVHHEIMLPEGVHERFRDASVLWNEVERCEKRKDSQVAKELVLALPDDAQVTLEDRLELTRRFANTHFVEKGLGVQLDIHEPDEEEKLVPAKAALVSGENLLKLNMSKIQKKVAAKFLINVVVFLVFAHEVLDE
jgi:MobA/MobL family